MSTSNDSEVDVDDDFYVRYYVGHKGRFGHEFLEFEFSASGDVRYANNSNYKGERCIRKRLRVSRAVLSVLAKMVDESEVLEEDDALWPDADERGDGAQELEIVRRDTHVSFSTKKIGSLMDCQKCEDPEGLKVLYYFVQDAKCLVLSLISMHMKVRPI